MCHQQFLDPRNVPLQTFLGSRVLLCHENQLYGNEKYTRFNKSGMREALH
jgi:hypothetical protein